MRAGARAGVRAQVKGPGLADTSLSRKFKKLQPKRGKGSYFCVAIRTGVTRASFPRAHFFNRQNMRIIGEIPHPRYKVTIFKMGERVSVKIENALYEQTYKLGDDERFQTPEGVGRLLDGVFFEAVDRVMQAMHQNRLQAIERSASRASENDFEEII